MAFSSKSIVIGVVVSLVLGVVCGYVVAPKGPDTTELEQQITQLMEQANSLQTQILDFQNQIFVLNNSFNELRTENDNLINQNAILEAGWKALSQELLDLQGYYYLINGPVSSFTTIQDLEIEFVVDHTLYYHEDSISGRVFMMYSNVTYLKGWFSVLITPEFGDYNSILIPSFSVDAHGTFSVDPPTSFKYGSGIYTISLGSIETLDGYLIADTHELNGTEIQVEAK